MAPLFIATLSALALSACAIQPEQAQPEPAQPEPAQSDSASRARELSFRPAIEAANKQLMDLYNSGDKAGVARMYEDNALMLNDRGSRYAGRGAIDKYWNPPAGSRPGSGSSPGKWTLEILSLDGNDHMPIQRGRSILEFPAPDPSAKPRISDVQFIVVWRKQPDNTYKIAVDAWWPTPP